MRRRGTLFLSLFIMAARCLGQHYPILPVPNSPHGIFTMMQDSRSALRLGTIDDVYCFDGEHFYSIRQYGFPKETPNTFAEDGEGGIWIGTQGTKSDGSKKTGGLYRYRAGRVAEVLAGDVLSVVKTAPGTMLASLATEGGEAAYGDLYRFVEDHGNWIARRLLTSSASHLTVDHQGSVLYPCPAAKTFCELSNAQITGWNAQTANDQGIDDQFKGHRDLERVLRDRFGCLWSRTQNSASYRCPGDRKETILPEAQEGLDASAFLEETPDGSVMMLGGLSLGRPGHFQGFGRHLGMPRGAPTTALIAHDGTLWLGAPDGLFRFMYPFHLEY